MPRVYQCSHLYVRGSLFKQTGRNLSQEQRTRVTDLITTILKDPSISPVRRKLVRNLKNTIGCEFAEGRDAIDTELCLVAWKAALHLFHRRYEYECEHCQSRDYLATTGRVSKFNRQLPVCPVCDHVKVGEQFVPRAQAADLVYSSPIRAIGKEPKYTPEQAEDLLNDPKQFIKLMSTFVTGYVKQVLRENKIKYSKTEQQITGPADIICQAELTGLLDSYSIKNWPSTSWGSQNTEINTTTSLLLAQPSFSVALARLRRRYAAAGVDLVVGARSIIIVSVGSPQVLTTTTTRWDPILVVADSESIGPGDDDCRITEHRYSLESNMSLATNHFEGTEMISAIRGNLFNPVHRDVYDILTEGRAAPPDARTVFLEFSMKHPNINGENAKNSQIAEFLGHTVKQVEMAKSTIKTLMLAEGLNVRDRVTEDLYPN